MRSDSNARNDAGPERARTLRSVVSGLLGWFAVAARDLPWRRRPSAYGIWVAEIMLQQTQVRTVVPYWQRWMRALPTVRSLARARPEGVLRLWEGLGYYQRARNLHKAARIIVNRHGGRFPREFDTVLALPGIGHYTAGAVCSIAFNQPTPVLDGNVARVLSRLFGIDAPPGQRRESRELWEMALALVQTTSACADLNQALMELGALVCLPRQPHCPQCPVRRLCVARRTNRVDALPRRQPRPPSVTRRFLAFVLEHRGRFLVQQRPPGVVNARLWEFPNVEITRGDLTPARRILAPLALESEQPTPLITIRHAITRFRIILESRHARLTARPPPGLGSGRWVSLRSLSRLPLARAHRKVLECLVRLRLTAMK